jgi:hypothetical protein
VGLGEMDEVDGWSEKIVTMPRFLVTSLSMRGDRKWVGRRS